MSAHRARRFAPPPLAIAAAAHAAGTLTGMTLAAGAAARVRPDPWLAVGFCMALLAIGSRLARGAALPRHLRASPRIVSQGLAALAPLLLVGAIGGADAGAAARRACTAAAVSGRAAVATGVLLDRIPAPAGRLRRPGSGSADATDRASVRLGAAELVSGGRRCRIDRLRVTAPRPAEALEAGAGVLVRGAWRRTGETRLPVAPERAGMLSAGAIQPVTTPGRIPGRVRLRGALSRRLDVRLAPPDAAAVAKALLLADRSTLGRDVRQRFVDAGIVHLLAISGLHVGMIAAAVVWGLGFADRGPRRWVWSAWVVTGYVAMIGAPPAATRAALVFWGHAACRRRDRPARIGDLGGVAALVALSLDPLLLVDPGFQLSFAGFAGVIAGHRGASRLVEVVGGGVAAPRWRRWSGYVMDGMLSSAGAFLLTAPISAVHFGRVVATSIPASVASTGLVALALPAIAAAALLPDPLGGWAGGAASLLIQVLVALAEAFAASPLRWRVSPGTGWAAVAIGLLALAAVRGRRRNRRWHVAALAASLAGWLVRPVVIRVAGRGTPLVCTLDVGQGDAAVVRTGAGRWLVFDAGPGTSVLEGEALDGGQAPLDPWMGDAGRNVIVPFLRARGARVIELFALSHPHLDHFGGSGALFDAFRVRNVLDPGVPEASSAYLAFLERVDDEHAAWVQATTGDVLAIDDVELRVLWPPPGAREGANETSLSFRLAVGGFAYVNTGDAPVETERAILARTPRAELHAQLLKLGHHGSRTSSSIEWLRAVDPTIAVVSLGRDNRYGHPHAVTLARLDSARVRQVWRTDIDGTLCIEVRPDGWGVIHP